MSRHKVTLQFEIEILDDAAATAFAAEEFRRTGQIAPDAKSPEESAQKYPAVAANVIAAEALRRGAQTFPWLRIERIDFGTTE